MLVLTRRVGEAILIDELTRVTVMAIDGNRIRLGISAPEQVRVDREEVHDRRVEPGTDGGPGAVSSVLARKLRSRRLLRALMATGT